MAASRPELVFLSGPQQAERAVLMTDRVVVGRSEQCEIHIKEQYASRQQVRFELTPDGWVVENLSVNGTRINGKRYKSGKSILLETGDVLSVGMETDVLFVAAGDDPEEALRKYRQGRPKDNGQAKETTAAQATPPGPPAVPAAAAPVAAAATQVAPKPAAISGGPVTAKKPLDPKVRKYTIYGGIYLGVLILVVVGLVMFGNKDKDKVAGSPPLLSDEDIAAAVNKPLERILEPALAQKSLAEAMTLYPQRDAEPRSRYRVVKDFKLFLAHKDGAGVFDVAEQEQWYDQAKTELTEKLTTAYRNAYAEEQAHRWGRANTEFNRVLNMMEPGDEAFKKLVANVLDHLKFIGHRINVK